MRNSGFGVGFRGGRNKRGIGNQKRALRVRALMRTKSQGLGLRIEA